MNDGYYDATVTSWKLIENQYGPAIEVVLNVQGEQKITTLSLSEDDVPDTDLRRWEQTLDQYMPYIGFDGGRDVTLLEERRPIQTRQIRIRLVTRVTERGSFQNCYIAMPRNGGSMQAPKSTARTLADKFMGKPSKDVLPF